MPHELPTSPAEVNGHLHVNYEKDRSTETEFSDWEQELATSADLQKADSWQHFLAMKIERDTGMEVQWRNGLGDHLHMVLLIRNSKHCCLSTAVVC